ncbi:hypothetical protein ACTJIJ_08005 [Niabella sp. 22666]|uniref:hypothetical protein n=1 Tax=Niabella sp. 22666 TaxID=3453954 RepID=UPI003F86E0F9
MPLIRCSEQKQLTLEEFYKEFIPNKVDTFADIGTPMLNVIKLINDTFKETNIYGLTSHATLLLLNKDCSSSPWFVALNGLETSPNGQRNEYYIEYVMTAHKQPWPDAKVKGGTTSLDELKNFIIIAMTESAGWRDCNELKALYSKLKLNNK